MTLLRTTGAFLGTDESTGSVISNNATTTGSVVDLLGDNTSVGDLTLYAVIVSTTTSGQIDFKLNSCRLSGQTYSKLFYEVSIPPTNGTQKIPLGKRPATRYMNVAVQNNATGANATVSVLYELEKLS